ncbi:hypothetical protein EVAR_70832_1 [Eumeta japonica]|uniref:Uncharacterized protein n=1 Tax=Eumeta variegata TaxID=151549 RepID=A0A4C1TGK7_EUMVA|nr:hypothetical protein EVAR_70832_1 [Eumeta japonica]
MQGDNGNNSRDVFSWDKLCSLLDDKLKDVTRKTDLNELRTEIDVLKKENLTLKNDVKKLTSRLDYIDRSMRLSNVVVTGLSSRNNNVAKTEFENLCADVLKVSNKIMSTRLLAGGKTFCFTLESRQQASDVLAAKNKLKGRRVYINKDYTNEEQNKRYKLRKLRRSIAACNRSVKVRLGEFCIFVENKKYTCDGNEIIANSNQDAVFLRSLTAEHENPFEIGVRVNQPDMEAMNTPSMQ